VENAISKAAASRAAFGDRVAGYANTAATARAVFFTMAKSTSFTCANSRAGLARRLFTAGGAILRKRAKKPRHLGALRNDPRSASTARSAAARSPLVGKSSGPRVSIRSRSAGRTERVLVSWLCAAITPDRLLLGRLEALCVLVGDLARAFVGVRVGAWIHIANVAGTRPAQATVTPGQ